jgi:hypothetical protein
LHHHSKSSSLLEEIRMKLGAGKLPNDKLLFGGIDGAPPSQNY